MLPSSFSSVIENPDLATRISSLVSNHSRLLLFLETDFLHRANEFHATAKPKATREDLLMDPLPADDERALFYRESEPLPLLVSSEVLRELGSTESPLQLPLFRNVSGQPREITLFTGHKIIPPEDADITSWIPSESDHLIQVLYAAWLQSRFPSTGIPAIQYTGPNTLPAESSRETTFWVQRIILSRSPGAGLRYLYHSGVLGVLLPEVASGAGLMQNRFHKYDIMEHLIRALDSVAVANETLRWAALLHDTGKVPTRREKANGEATFYNHEMESAKQVVPIMKRFGVDKETGKKVRFLVRHHMFHYTHEWTDKAIRRFLRKVPKEDMAMLVALRLADRRGSGKNTALPNSLIKMSEHIQEIQRQEQELKVRDLAINGYELMEMGFTAGPQMGLALKAALDAVKNGLITNEKDELKNFVENFRSGGTAGKA